MLSITYLHPIWRSQRDGSLKANDLCRAFPQLSLCIHPLATANLLLSYRAPNFATSDHHCAWHSLTQIFMPEANLPLYLVLLPSIPQLDISDPYHHSHHTL